jgi:hypothetical protein
MDRSLLQYRPEIEAFESRETTAQTESADEMQLAAELLDRVDEGELEAYLVDLINRASKTADRPLHSTLAKILTNTARRLIPRTGAPPNAAAARVFGVELEGLSPEDRTFEVARHFVRFASEAARRAGRVGSVGVPHAAAVDAAASAARTLAPGLLPALHGADKPVLSSKESAMHDMDRTQMEYAAETEGFEAEQFGYEGEWSTETGAVLSEADEYELASELLGVSSEEELDQFLGGLIKKVAKGAGRLFRGPVGQAVGGVLKGVAKKAMPLAGGALDAVAPLGAKIGSGVAAATSDAPGVEGEMLAQEDQEFEGAKQFVRLAANTVKKAAAAPASADPRTVAKSAAISAARQLAPGLLKKNGGDHHLAGASGNGHSGRWARRGNTIVLFGV